MPAGKATGRNRVYQEDCRRVIAYPMAQQNTPLSPHSGDGIDQPFTMGGTTWHLDVALHAADGRLVVAECKRYRWRRPVEQDEIAAFAYKLILLRQSTGYSVVGYFVAKSRYRAGAHNAAAAAGIFTCTLKDDQPFPDFMVTIESVVDHVRRILRSAHVVQHVQQPTRVRMHITVHRTDGTTEHVHLE